MKTRNTCPFPHKCLRCSCQQCHFFCFTRTTSKFCISVMRGNGMLGRTPFPLHPTPLHPPANINKPLKKSGIIIFEILRCLVSPRRLKYFCFLSCSSLFRYHSEGNLNRQRIFALFVQAFFISLFMLRLLT